MQKIKKGDTVFMRSGSSKGKSGKVLAVLPSVSRLVVEGLNLMTKHRKPRRQGEQGQKVQLPRSVPISSVMLKCPQCGKPTRVGFRSLAKETKARFCKECNAVIA